MTDRAIQILRWVLLVSVLINLLQATLLRGFFHRRVFEPWIALNERHGRKIPATMRDERAQRFWPLFVAVVLLVLWWYLGTPSGVALLRKE